MNDNMTIYQTDHQLKAAAMKRCSNGDRALLGPAKEGNHIVGRIPFV
jgi:hypothetical protein